MIGSRKTRFMQELAKLRARVIIFDLDLTACRMHTLGILQRKKLPLFLAAISPDFKAIVPALFEAGYEVAIATFNDARVVELVRMYGPGSVKGAGWGAQELAPEDIIAGDELVDAFLRHNFDDAIAAKVAVAAFNPILREGDAAAQDKNTHLARIAAELGRSQDECVLFDDKEDNVTGFKGRAAFLVDGGRGFVFEDLPDQKSEKQQ